ncbi:MAG TPA: M50 family metallopeptidase [Candidatus Limnocylindrales bacterium]|jgi:regulator of sigma E protease
MDGILYALLAFVLFVVILGSLVLVHELGHYLVAKRFDVRVLEFGIGFPPRAKVLRSKGETLWTLNWLPIGGFVRLDGEDGDAATDPRSFSAKPLRVRLTILVAGVAMNVLVAFLIFFSIALLATPVTSVRIGHVEAAGLGGERGGEGSPAAAAGLQAGDEILRVDGQQFDVFGGGDVTSTLRADAGRAVTLTVLGADGTQRDVAVTLRPAAELSDTRGALGIQVSDRPVTYIGHDLGTSAGIAGNELVRWGGLIVRGLGDLVSGFIKDPSAAPPASGPIGIAASLADILLGAGPILLLYVAGILSINLGVVNILPFPPLDGGRMAVLVIKRVFGPRVSLRAERVTYAIGAVFLLVFVLWITGFDIARLSSTP